MVPILKYILKRGLQSFFTLIFVISIAFILLRFMPEEGYFGDDYEKLDENQKEAILENLGLKDPIYIQLLNFYKQLISGDLGKSIKYRPGIPVYEILRLKIPYSVKFGLSAMGISLIIGIPMGILMVAYKDSIIERLGMVYILLVNSIPAAIYFIILQIYITRVLKLPILFSEENPMSWILPAFSMSLGGIGSYAMWMRRYLMDEVNKDYAQLARAKGLTRRGIMVNHLLRNAFVPMSQYLPSGILFTIAGSIYIESLYSIPGMGGLLVEAIQGQDNPLVQILVIIYSSIGIFGLLLGDILMATLDPRIKLDSMAGGGQ